ncbi:MAG TPA: DUF5666 domain-containing protein [Terriglobales bacterium]|nr:DUF5666 domain-containing protein [Terriglobales bacterium]
MPHSKRRFFAILGVLSLLSMFWLLPGCELGSGGGGGGGGNKHTATVTLLVNIGDAPVDRVVALDMTINQVTLTSSGGGTTNLLSAPAKVEFRHIAGSLQPLATTTLSQDTFTQANITLSATAHATVLDDTGVPRPQQTVTLGTTSFSVGLGSIAVSTTPMVLNLDFNMSSSVNVDPSFNVTITPSFVGALVPIVPTSPEVESGKFEDVDGTITGISSPNFTLAVEQAANSLTIATNTSTQFVGVAGLSGLAASNVVEVTGAVQSDGSLLATKVEALDLTPGGLEVNGMVTSITGAPATSVQEVVQNEATPTLTQPTLGGLFNVNGMDTAAYAEDTDEVDFTGLTLPAFTATTLTKGQQIRVTTSTPSATTITTGHVTLQQQAVTGQVLSSSGSGQGTSGIIILNLPADSYLTLLTGETQVTVFQQTSTRFVGITSVGAGDTVRARGLLLFNSGATPHWQMVASRLTPP